MSGGVGLFGVSLMAKIIRGDWVVWRSGIIWCILDGQDNQRGLGCLEEWDYLERWDSFKDVEISLGLSYIYQIIWGCGIIWRFGIMWKSWDYVEVWIMWRN